MGRLAGWVVILAFAWALFGVVRGQGIVSTSSGCQSHLNEDPTWGTGADWYGFVIGVCLPREMLQE